MGGGHRSGVSNFDRTNARGKSHPASAIAGDDKSDDVLANFFVGKKVVAASRADHPPVEREIDQNFAPLGIQNRAGDVGELGESPSRDIGNEWIAADLVARNRIQREVNPVAYGLRENMLCQHRDGSVPKHLWL